MTNAKYHAIDLFAGVGGIRLGFEQAFGNKMDTVFVSEMDKWANKTYALNFGQEPSVAGDITKVEAKDIPAFDIGLAGFPCQAFSIAGKRRGFEDIRGTLFFDVMRIVSAHRPRVVFLENVKNLLTHDHGNTFAVILASLDEIGYHVKYIVMNACRYGNVPQNRERIYIVAFREQRDAERFAFPEPIPLTTSLSDVINFAFPVPEKYYYRPGRYADDQIYQALCHDALDPNVVYQWRRRYVRANKSGVVPTLTANMGTGGHNVPIVFTPYGWRKLTPRECFNVQGFPDTFLLPNDVSDGRLYKQAGNSVCVPVIKRIATRIFFAL